MRWFSIRAQICASRPSAVTKKSGARSARKRRWKSRARAAASNAGPRLAEVAGSAKRSERSCDVGREGIVKKQTPWRPKLTCGNTRASYQGIALAMPKDFSKSMPLLGLGISDFPAALQSLTRKQQKWKALAQSVVCDPLPTGANN